MKNIDKIREGLEKLLPYWAGFLEERLKKEYGSGWWQRVLEISNFDHFLPKFGDDEDKVRAIDISLCAKIMLDEWNSIFWGYFGSSSGVCRYWVTEIRAIRNTVSHTGSGDVDRPYVIRSLDTMARLLEKINFEASESIWDLYNSFLEDGKKDYPPVVVHHHGIDQPVSDSKSGPMGAGSLLMIDDPKLVQKTMETRKVSFGGKTVSYPVYRVNLDLLYYNDQNDRIATWITQYEASDGKGSLTELDHVIFNQIIEGFIADSNPEAISRTEANIRLAGQLVAGVTLADGRVVDGNRRFTCLRRIRRESEEPVWFETVIMDLNIETDRRQIKLLELAVQHGEEKKVDYDLIDYAVGTYRDIVQTELLTVAEYAENANESEADVKKRITIAENIGAFLNYIHLPEQYHVARELQVYSLFQEMLSALNKLTRKAEKEQLKQLSCCNVLLEAEKDNRKFIRDIRKLVQSGKYAELFAESDAVGIQVLKRLEGYDMHGVEDVRRFSEENEDLRCELRTALDRALEEYRRDSLMEKPIQDLKEAEKLLLGINMEIVKKMDPEDRSQFAEELAVLQNLVGQYIARMDG